MNKAQEVQLIIMQQEYDCYWDDVNISSFYSKFRDL